MIVWVQRCLPSRANKWIQRRVGLINQSIKVRQNRLKHFLDIYLESDGIFMIRMIANNTSDYVATDLIHHLWCQHAENYDQLFPDDPHNIADVPCEYDHKKYSAHTKVSKKEESADAGFVVTNAPRFPDNIAYPTVYNNLRYEEADQNVNYPIVGLKNRSNFSTQPTRLAAHIEQEDENDNAIRNKLFSSGHTKV